MTNSVSIDLDDGRGRIEGYCASRFQPVLDVFVDNFRQRGEVGASADGRTFVGSDTLVGMEEISGRTNFNQTFLTSAAWSLGFMKSMDNRR